MLIDGGKSARSSIEMQPPMTDKANITTNLGSNITCLCYSSYVGNSHAFLILLVFFFNSNDVLAVATAKLTGNVWNGSFFTLGDSGQINHRIEMEHGLENNRSLKTSFLLC